MPDIKLNLEALGVTQGSDDGSPGKPRRLLHLAFWEAVVAAGFAFGLVLIVLFTCSAAKSWCEGLSLFGRIALLAAAAWVTGGFLGFLLGIPRVRSGQQVAMTERQQELQNFAPNTNLEQISDWLTKILIGATLVNLRDFSNFLWNLAGLASADLAEVSGAQITMLAVIVFYLLCGLIWGYLWSSIRIIRALSEA